MPDATSLILPKSWQKGELRTVAVTLVVCCLTAILSSRLHTSPLATELIVSNCIGWSCYGLMQVIRVFLRGRLPVWGLVISIPVGFIVGSQFASLFGAPNVAAGLWRHPGGQPILDTVLMVAVVTAFFLYFSHSRGVHEEWERERRRAAEAQQAETAARLALLQAQIEPHFLFNTLANIHSLIEEDPAKAGRVLEDLNAYLRTSLRRTRQAHTSLDEELQLAAALLAIAKARLGPRLQYAIAADQELRSCRVPPLLLQPLVENAIRHGIEPSVQGGSVHVSVVLQPDGLDLTVSDTGVGLNESSPPGVGLANIRARLDSLYGDRGSLTLYTNVPNGLVAKLLIPLDRTPPTADRTRL
ncbi:MAG TPA: histidine kinase [Steroidobacteraceae bacterium]